MGHVRVKGLIGDAQQASVREQDFLADGGAFYTVIPPNLAKELGIQPLGRTKLTLANDRLVEVGVSLAYIKILDREGVLSVAITDLPEHSLGVTSLRG